MNSKRILDYLVNTGTMLILLEPVWMLLPFAGFLYGSILNLEFLKNNHLTVWLLYFIFPVQTLFPFAWTLIFLGCALFLLGAFRIYLAKLRETGMVKTGIYKKFRHPQYTGLTIFCIGFLLIWGRFITYILFFLMMFLYYSLAKREEKNCILLFGKEYEAYMKKTYFLFPGERAFAIFGEKLTILFPQRVTRNIVSLVLVMGIGIGSCFGILAVRDVTSSSMPFARYHIADESGKRLETILLTGYENPTPGMKIEGIRQKTLEALPSSVKFRDALRKINTKDIKTLFGFVIPFTVKPVKEYRISFTDKQQKDFRYSGMFDVFLLQINSSIELNGGNFEYFRKNWRITGALQINKIDSERILEKKDEIIMGDINIFSPLHGESKAEFNKRMEMIFNIYLYSYREKVIPVAPWIKNIASF